MGFNFVLNGFCFVFGSGLFLIDPNPINQAYQSVLFLWLLTKQSLRRDDWFRLHIFFTHGYVTPELIINSPHWRTHLLDLYNSFHYLTRSIIFPLLEGNRVNLYIFDFVWWWWWWYDNGFSCWFQAPKKEKWSTTNL